MKQNKQNQNHPIRLQRYQRQLFLLLQRKKSQKKSQFKNKRSSILKPLIFTWKSFLPTNSKIPSEFTPLSSFLKNKIKDNADQILQYAIDCTDKVEFRNRLVKGYGEKFAITWYKKIKKYLPYKNKKSSNSVLAKWPTDTPTLLDVPVGVSIHSSFCLLSLSMF